MSNDKEIFLFLARHAEAKSAAFSAGRPLSDRGIVEATLLGENLKKKDNFEIRTIINSGILRSEQTSEIINKEIGHGKIIQNERLAEGFQITKPIGLPLLRLSKSPLCLLGTTQLFSISFN